MADISMKQLLQAWAIGDSPGSRTIDIRGENSLRAIASTLAAAAPMDLVWIEQDQNGLPMNPRWGYQAQHPGELPDLGQLGCAGLLGDLRWQVIPCSTQQTFFDSAAICETPFGGGSHRNWFPATYDGQIYFDSYSGGWHPPFGPYQDYDWNWYLDTPNQAGITNGNNGPGGSKMLTLEFDTRETINDVTTEWWLSFHNAVDSGYSDGQYTEARAMVNGKYAIVTGLIGLDCAHSCGSESHPVYTMAIHVNDQPLDDVWAIMVRNWGNEGFCGTQDHKFDFLNDTYTFRLPWRSDAWSVAQHPNPTPFQRNNTNVWGPNVTPVPGKAVLVSFQLPSPYEQAWAFGELHLQWESGSPAAMHPVSPDSKFVAATASPAEEGKLDRFIAAMTPAQRETFLQEVPQMPDPATHVPPQDMPAQPFANPPVHRVPPRLGLENLQVRSVMNADKANFDQLLMERLRTVSGGTIPGSPSE
jgi:hypothetical protein